MSRFGVWIPSGPSFSVEAWGELCISTVADLQACVLRVADESLHVLFELRDLSPLSLGDIKRSATLCRRLAHRRQRGPNAEYRGEPLQRRSRSGS